MWPLASDCLLVALVPCIFLLYHFIQCDYKDVVRKVRKSWWHPFQKPESLSGLIGRGYKYASSTDEPFRVTYWGEEYVILPMKYIRDLKQAHKDHLSFFGSIQDIFFMKFWVGDLLQSDRMVYVVKKGLNPHLNEVTDICIGETDAAIRAELGDSDSPVSLPVLQVCSGIAHRVASKILVGDELCYDSAFRKASYEYFQGHVMTGYILFKVPTRWLRNILAGPLSYYQRHRKHKVLGLVVSVLERRLDKTITSGKTSSANLDCIDWALRMKDDFPASGTEKLLWQVSHELIHLLGAAHAPTGMTMTHMLWQLSHQPQYLGPLRREAEDAISRFGFTSKIVDHLPYLDSFMAETNRLFPSNKLGLPRLVSGSDFTLHDGLTLPAGTRIAFPVQDFLLDRNVFDNPDRFDGFRFVHLKESDARTEEGVNTWMASHANKWNLAFGYGNHSCPGRFFAVRLIKMIFVKLLVDYDFQSDWPRDEIPPGLEMEGALIPNISACMIFTRRSRSAGARG